MTSETQRQAAKRSAARQSARKSPSPPPPAVPDPEGVIKTSPRGTQYRVYTIPLSDYPAFMKKKKFVPKMYFHFKPEEDKSIPETTEENKLRKYRSGFVLGVRREDDKEDREL